MCVCVCVCRNVCQCECVPHVYVCECEDPRLIFLACYVDTQLLLAAVMCAHTCVCPYLLVGGSGQILLCGIFRRITLAGWGAPLPLISHCQPVFQVAVVTHSLCLLITDSPPESTPPAPGDATTKKQAKVTCPRTWVCVVRFKGRNG